MSGSAWSGDRSGNLSSNVRGPPVVKAPSTTWNEYASEASSAKASTGRHQPAPLTGWDELYAAQVSPPKASAVRQQPAPQTSNQTMLPPHLRAATATQASKPTPPMNAGKLAKSAKHDSKVPCTYEDCTRGFTKETDMKRHKDDDHEWCRLCNVDCADDEALLEHKVQSDKHICCDVCGEDFRSDTGKERHMRQVSS